MQKQGRNDTVLLDPATGNVYEYFDSEELAEVFDTPTFAEVNGGEAFNTQLRYAAKAAIWIFLLITEQRA